MDNFHERRALPEGWEWKRLGDVAQFFYGYPFDSSKFNDERSGTPLIRIRNLIDGKTETYYDGEFDESYIIKNGDTLIGMDGEFNIVKWTGQEALLNQRVCKLNITSKELESAYAYRVLVKILKRIEDKTPYVTVKHLSAKHLNSIQIPLPPLPTQRRIVSILEKAEETKGLRAQADELTDRLLQSVFMEMFGDPVKNPMGWEMMKLRELTEISSGSTPSRDVPAYFGGEIPWVKTTEVKGIRIHDTEEYITMSGLNNSSCKIYPKKSIIIAMYGQGKTRGNVGLLEIDATTNQACCVLKPNQKYDSVYLFELLRNSYNNLRNLGRGGNQPNLNGEIIKNYVIPLPSLPLQQEFARIVEKIESMCQSQNQSKQQIEDLFSALMQKAFRGEI